MKIASVTKGSMAAKLGINAGDAILSIGGHPIEDILDYYYFDELGEFSLQVLEQNGDRIKNIEVIKINDRPFGINFVEDGIEVKRCHNNCVFCFVNQLPKDKNLRKTLFVKDDDYRYSFLNGTYITLSNMSPHEIERIKRIKLSPLYISVHTTNAILRGRMLGYKSEAPILERLQDLYDGGIRFHTQIVYCPNINEDIEKTARDLAPMALSLAVVPVGLTDCKNPDMKVVSKEEAKKVLGLVHRLQKEFIEEYGSNFIWAADEFYLKAGEEFPEDPECDFYEDYPQIENGVGLFSQFDESYQATLIEKAKFITKNFNKKNENLIKQILIVTGSSASNFITKRASEISFICNKVANYFNINVVPIENHFFGKTVTVTGLLVGEDIYQGVTTYINANNLDKQHTVVLIPSVCFREDKDDFLDSKSLEWLEKELGVRVRKTETDGASFVNVILEEGSKK